MKHLFSSKTLLPALLLAAFSVASTRNAHATVAGQSGPSPEVKKEDEAATQLDEQIEVARLRIHDAKNGEIEGSRDGGKTWELIGHVTQPTQKANIHAYNASRYAPIGTVAATAVNAIHIKIGFNKKDNQGIIFSLSPKAETEAGKLSLQSEVSPGSSAFTDNEGGNGIFGGPFTPFVGNKVFLDNDRNNVLTPLPDGYTPKLGDSWTIPITRPRHYPREVVFENRFGGLITIQYRGEKPRVIGQVLRPVLGIGRFVGSYFSDVGRLRANHNGVIDISTSPFGYVGSFQIVPANHAMSPETHYIRELTQWMVIGPVSALDKSWEGTAPLFSSYLRPRYDRDDLWNKDPIEGLAGRFRFEVKLRGSNAWKPMPMRWVSAKKSLPSWAGTALANMTALRIVFPFAYNDGTSTALNAPAGTTMDAPASTLEKIADPNAKSDAEQDEIAAQAAQNAAPAPPADAAPDANPDDADSSPITGANN